MESQKASSSLQARQTTDGSATQEPASADSSPRKRFTSLRRSALTKAQEIEIARLYKEKAGTAREIGAIYGVHHSTVFSILDDFNVPRHYPRLSAAATQTMKRRWEKERESNARIAKARAKAGQEVYSPDLSDQYLVAERPAPAQGVDIDAVHHKPKRTTKRRKVGWFRRLMFKLFG